MTYHTARYFYARDKDNLANISCLHPNWERRDCISELNKRWRKVPKKEKGKYQKMSKDSKREPEVVESSEVVESPEVDGCSVCYDFLWLTSSVCGHKICVGCLLKLQKKECPMCRNDLTEGFPIEDNKTDYTILEIANMFPRNYPRLPVGWYSRISRSRNYQYFINRITGEAIWNYPRYQWTDEDLEAMMSVDT